MKEIKLFDLIERSFVALKKTNKKIWIIGIIIAIFSGGLIIDNSAGEDVMSDIIYDNANIDENYEEFSSEYADDEMLADLLSNQSIGFFIGVFAIVILIFLVIFTIMSILIYIGNYYLYHSTFEALFDTSLERASLGLVVKVNMLVVLKIIVGLILFIIPGIVLGIKYAPANYILCKHPNLSSKEILSKTREISSGFKWKIFLYDLFLTIISGILLFICVPSSYIGSSSLVYILSLVISLGITTFITVYTGIFNVYLFNDIEYFKDSISTR